MPVSSRRTWPVALAGAIVLLAGCAPEPPSGTETTGATSPAPTASAAASPTATADPVPSGAVLSNTVLPTDCRGMLDEGVLAQLADVPLNDPSFGASGVLPDRSLRCVWGAAGADTTRLVTTVNYAPKNDVIDYLNALAADGFVCYEPQGGLRCEHTWQDERFPVTDGRTLYYRDGVLIDTQYSNLSPAGYTAAIVRSLWPDAPAPES